MDLALNNLERLMCHKTEPKIYKDFKSRGKKYYLLTSVLYSYNKYAYIHIYMQNTYWRNN